MPLLPKKHAERIAFFQTRNTVWTTNAVAIGTTTTAVSAVATAAAAAATALAEQEIAQNAAMAATETLRLAMDSMTNQGMAIVEQVRTKARSAGDGVYPLANIPAPKTPTHPADPGTPNRVTVTIAPATGAFTIAWKCTNSAGGAMYQVYRTVDDSTEETFVGGVGAKKIIDYTVPAGAMKVTYMIQAVRSTGAGEWASFLVKLGAGGSSSVTATGANGPKNPTQVIVKAAA